MPQSMIQTGNSCFHYASKSNHFDVVAYLYEIDDNYACMKNKDDKLPLQLAAESGNTKITSFNRHFASFYELLL